MACDTRFIEPDLIRGLPRMTDKVRSYIATASASSRGDDKIVSRDEIDMHTNMALVGKNTYILTDKGTTIEVNAFIPGQTPITIKIFDASVQYDFPYDRTTYILLI